MARTAALPITSASVVAAAAKAAFGKPLVTNVYRSIIVDAMVAAALGEAWKWCSADYAGWDIESPTGTRLEVKQSAARQSWLPSSAGYRPPSFDIAERTGRWRDGSTWIANCRTLGESPLTEAVMAFGLRAAQCFAEKHGIRPADGIWRHDTGNSFRLSHLVDVYAVAIMCSIASIGGKLSQDADPMCGR